MCKQNYCLGIVFNYDLSQILLLRRNRNPYIDRLNGIGGHVEMNEIPRVAMYRELREETKILTFEVERCIDVVTESFPNGVTLHVYAIQTNYVNIACLSGPTEEGILEAYNSSIYCNVTQPNLAGDGNLPYFIQYGKQLLLSNNANLL